MVRSTLHIDDAVTAVPRLLDLTLDRSPMSSTLPAILAQRLVEKLCSFCKTVQGLIESEGELFHDHGIATDSALVSQGCSRCVGLGYSGRTAINEVFTVDDDMRELNYANASITTHKAVAMRQGMTPLRNLTAPGSPIRSSPRPSVGPRDRVLGGSAARLGFKDFTCIKPKSLEPLIF